MTYNDDWGKSQGETPPRADTIDDPEMTYGQWIANVGDILGFDALGKIAELYEKGYTPEEAAKGLERAL